MRSAELEKAAELAGRHAAAAEVDRRLLPEVAHALVAAGFPGHFVPAAHGGVDGGAAALLDMAETVGRSCTSAAWCGALTAGAARMGVYLPERGQAELWADGPDAVVAGALIPVGRAEPARGGWLLSGAWPVTSAVDHADWALVAAEPGPLFLAVPRPVWRVLASWDAAGMRGTGSNTLVLPEPVFVPAHRAFDRAEMLRGNAVGSTSPCHVAPLRAISGILFAAPALGAARGALSAWAGGAADAPDDRRVLAEATTTVDAAALLLRDVAVRCDRGELPPDATLRNAHHCAVAVGLLVDVAERLVRTAGFRAQQAVHPLQRFWRDLHTLAAHVALRAHPAADAYGAHLLARLDREDAR